MKDQPVSLIDSGKRGLEAGKARRQGTWGSGSRQSCSGACCAMSQHTSMAGPPSLDQEQPGLHCKCEDLCRQLLRPRPGPKERPPVPEKSIEDYRKIQLCPEVKHQSEHR